MIIHNDDSDRQFKKSNQNDYSEQVVGTIIQNDYSEVCWVPIQNDYPKRVLRITIQLAAHNDHSK